LFALFPAADKNRSLKFAAREIIGIGGNLRLWHLIFYPCRSCLNIRVFLFLHTLNNLLHTLIIKAMFFFNGFKLIGKFALFLGIKIIVFPFIKALFELLVFFSKAVKLFIIRLGN